MFGGNMQQMQQMMQQMGIDMEDINAEEVVIKTESGEKLIFDNPDVNKMDAKGQTIYQVMGEPNRTVSDQEEADEEESDDGENSERSESDNSDGSNLDITDEDVNIVSLRAGVSEDVAREKLEEKDGDLAKAISELEG